MLVRAFLSVMTAPTTTSDATAEGLSPLTCNESRRLFTSFRRRAFPGPGVTAARRPATCMSRWTRLWETWWPRATRTARKRRPPGLPHARADSSSTGGRPRSLPRRDRRRSAPRCRACRLSRSSAGPRACCRCTTRRERSEGSDQRDGDDAAATPSSSPDDGGAGDQSGDDRYRHFCLQLR